MPDIEPDDLFVESEDDGSLRELRNLEIPGSSDFFKRVQRSIYRRSSGAQFAVFACELSPGLAWEFGQMVAHALRVTAVSQQGGHSEEGRTITNDETRGNGC